MRPNHLHNLFLISTSVGTGYYFSNGPPSCLMFFLITYLYNGRTTLDNLQIQKLDSSLFIYLSNLSTNVLLNLCNKEETQTEEG